MITNVDKGNIKAGIVNKGTIKSISNFAMISFISNEGFVQLLVYLIMDG